LRASSRVLRPAFGSRPDPAPALVVLARFNRDSRGAAKRQGVAFVVWSESANLSMVERQLGNLDRVEELSRQAVDTATAREHDLYLGWTLNGLAAVTAAKGDAVRAATILGAAASLLQRGGGEWPPDEFEQFEETDAALGRVLPPGELDHTRAHGAAMSREQAVAYALSYAQPRATSPDLAALERRPERA
jgi:hypothetical protein